MNSQLKPFLVAEGTDVTAYRELVCFQNCKDSVFSILNIWFKVRKLSLNFHKTDLISCLVRRRGSCTLNWYHSFMSSQLTVHFFQGGEVS